MPKGKLSDEDRNRLDEHFWSIVTAACRVHRCWRGEVLNSRRKAGGIPAARAAIVKEMRRTAFTFYVGLGSCRLWLPGHEAREPTPNKLDPVSFPLLSRMIGVDHSGLVLAQQKLKKAKENDHA